MSVQIQYLRGSAAQLNAFTGAQAEIVVNTSDYTLRVMDGATTGGFPLVGTTQVQTLSNKTLASPIFTGNISMPGNVTAGNIFSTGYYWANGSPFTSFSNVDVGNYLEGNVVVDIIPAANVTYSLGNSTNQWLDLWISNSTIYMNSIPISLASGNILTVGGANLMPQNSNLVLTSGGLTTTGAISANAITGNTLSVAGNVSFANVSTNALSVTTLTASGNVTANNLASLNGISGELTTPTQPNITSVGVLSALTVGPTGIITAGPVTAATLGGSLTTAAQPNITSVGTLASLTATGNITSTNGNLSAGNIIATQSLVATNLTTTGNVTAGNVNTTGQANIGTLVASGTGTFGANVSAPNVFTNGAYWQSNAQPILTANGNLYVGNTAVTGSLTTTGNINTPAINWSNGTPIISPTGNINCVNLNASSRVTATGNITSGANISAQNFIGNGSFLTGIQTQTANTAIQVTGNSQGNITSVGTLTTLNVAGTVSAVAFFGDGGYLSNIQLANTVGVVANANYSLNANNAVFSGTVTTNAQPNITSVGTLSNLTVAGSITGDTLSASVIGNIGADFIGNSVSVLQVGNTGTNFTGTLDANSAIQSNITTVGNLTLLNVDNRVTAASFAGDGGFLGNLVGANVTGTVANANYSLFGNASVYSTYANVANTVNDNAQPNVTSLGTLVSLGVTGNITTSNTGNINAGGFFTGDGAGISNIRGAIVTGTVANANYALFGNASVYSTYANVANTVNDAAQPNITSVGTLVNLTSSGNITTSANIAGAYFIGNGIALANITGANVNGTVANANYSLFGNASVYSTYANVANTVADNAQPNITSVGTLTSLAITNGLSVATISSPAGNATFGNVTFTGNVVLPGNITQISGNQGQFFGDSTGANALYAGLAAANIVAQPYTVLQITADSPDYAQVNFQNENSGPAASTDYVATADNGDVNTYYVNMGIASSTWDDSSANTIGNVINKNDSYLYAMGDTSVAPGGNLVLGAATPGKFVKIIAGGGTTDDVVAEFGINDAYITGNLNLTGPGNIITVGNTSAAYYFGNASTLSGIIPQASVANTVNDAAQPNITSVGTLTSLAVTGNVSGNVFTGNAAGMTNIPGANIVGNITGNISNAAVATAVGGGANNQILFQTGSGVTGFAVAPLLATTYLKWDGNAFVWDAVAASSLDNPLTFNALGTGVVPGTVYDATAANTVSYNTFGAAAANGVNATGTWTINTSGYAGTVSANAQPNITTVGNLVSLQVDGGVNATSFTGSGAFLTSITGANVTGYVLNANNAIQAQQSTIAGTAFRADYLIQNNQPNLTQFGSLANLTVIGASQVTTINSSGNATLSAVISDNYYYSNGQPLFGSSGSVSAGNIVASGTSTVTGNSSAANFNTAGQMVATGNASAANFNTTGVANVGTLTTVANATVGGGLTVTGTTTFNSTVDATTINAAQLGNTGTVITGASVDAAQIGNAGTNFDGATATFTSTVTGETFTSTVATGTAPFTVASTTLVANLNANLLNGLYNTSSNVPSTIISRDGTASFSAGTITMDTVTGVNVYAGQIGNTGATVTAATVNAAQIGNTGTTLTGTLDTASNAQPNVTSLGILTGLTVSGAILPNANATVNIGAAGTRFNMIYGVASSAQYADLAESYVGDHKYESGTVVSFGGANEVTQSSVDGDRRVAGVVSTNPAYLMNSDLHEPNTVAVALTGRVPTKVTGPVRKGDLMVSAGDGTARSEEDPRAGSIIGKALADFDGATGVIEVVVGRF